MFGFPENLYNLHLTLLYCTRYLSLTVKQSVFSFVDMGKTEIVGGIGQVNLTHSIELVIILLINL